MAEKDNITKHDYKKKLNYAIKKALVLFNALIFIKRLHDFTLFIFS